jgi:hypothetical protein
MQVVQEVAGQRLYWLARDAACRYPSLQTLPSPTCTTSHSLDHRMYTLYAWMLSSVLNHLGPRCYKGTFVKLQPYDRPFIRMPMYRLGIVECGRLVARLLIGPRWSPTPTFSVPNIPSTRVRIQTITALPDHYGYYDFGRENRHVYMHMSSALHLLFTFTFHFLYLPQYTPLVGKASVFHLSKRPSMRLYPAF